LQSLATKTRSDPEDKGGDGVLQRGQNDSEYVPLHSAILILLQEKRLIFSCVVSFKSKKRKFRILRCHPVFTYISSSQFPV
jgi:hypothetical protein